MRISQIKEKRIKLEAYYNALKEFDGKHIRRLSDKTQAQIKAINDKHSDVSMPQLIISNKPYMIDLTGLKNEITQLEELIHANDTFETIPEIQELSELNRAYLSKLNDCILLTTAKGLNFDDLYSLEIIRR